MTAILRHALDGVNLCPLRRALERVPAQAVDTQPDTILDWGLDFADAFIVPGHPARDALTELGHEIEEAREKFTEVITVLDALPPGSPERDEQSEAVRNVRRTLANALGNAVERVLDLVQANPVQLLVLRDRAQLEQFRADNRIGGDWHEPSEITTRVTKGSFDNASTYPSDLEQTLIFYSEEEEYVGNNRHEVRLKPLACINLAVLCSLATGYNG